MTALLASLAFLDGLGFSEMLVIVFVSVLVFGDRLPEVMRNLGRTYAHFRRSLTEVSRPLRDEIRRATTLPPEITHPLLPYTTPAKAGPGTVIDVQPLPSAPAPSATPPPTAPPPTSPPASQRDDYDDAPLI